MDVLTVLYHAAVAVLIAVFGIVLGRAVRRVVDRILFRLSFNDWFRNFNIGRALLRSGYTPSEFFGSVAAGFSTSSSSSLRWPTSPSVLDAWMSLNGSPRS